MASSGVIGRPTGLQLGTSGSPTSEQSITYGYDTYGRFNSLAGGGTTLAYAYTSNSNLLASIADSVSGWTQTRTYLSNRDLLDVIETKVSTTSKAKFDYAHDNLGRRTGVNKTGGLYSRYGNGTQGLDTTWGYDDRSQVTAEQSYLGGTATTLTGRVDAYAWDNIGNRSSTAGTTHNGSAAAYSANALNQYTQRDVVSVFDVAGAAGSGTTVTVNTSSAGVTRHGEYFFKGHSLSNSTGAVFTTLAISDGSTTTNLPAFLAKTAEVFSYDDEGNLTSDGRWDYAYDAENRLVSMQTHGYNATTYAIANADARRLEFTYDYLGRRVEKLVRAGWNGSAFTTVLSDEKFVYSGWNIMAKLNAASSNALMASYYWGLDWSGTLQGAGGVGGLALIVESGSTYLPMFDGNGNVMGLIKASTGSIDAAYEFDAFGNTIRESGTYAASNPFRFSTKYTDVETSLVYYGLRYYSPSLGRFINKDPIEERGGLNLYGFCLNNAIARWDYMGMDPIYAGGWLPTMVVTPNGASIGGFSGFGGFGGFASSSGSGFGFQGSANGQPGDINDKSDLEKEMERFNRQYPGTPSPSPVPQPTANPLPPPQVALSPINPQVPISGLGGLTPGEILSAALRGAGQGLYNNTIGHLVSAGREAGQMYVDARTSGSGAGEAVGLAVSQGLGRVSGGLGLLEFYSGNRIDYGEDGSLQTREFDGIGEWAIHGATSYTQAVSSATALGGITSRVAQNLARRAAVRKAWVQERQLVRTTGQGTRNWTEGEIQELLNRGRVEGYHGHHINSVNAHPHLAGDPNNISFVTPDEHFELHNFNWQNATSGPMHAR